jgi:hypothetical protein
VIVVSTLCGSFRMMLPEPVNFVQKVEITIRLSTTSVKGQAVP